MSLEQTTSGENVGPYRPHLPCIRQPQRQPPQIPYRVIQREADGPFQSELTATHQATMTLTSYITYITYSAIHLSIKQIVIVHQILLHIILRFLKI